MRFWNNNSSKMVILATGNVGIGTTSPGYKLDVRSSLATIAMFDGTYAGIQGIQVQRNGGDNVRLTANYSGFGGGLESSDALRFSVNGANISNPSMYIETTGNVGIGTTSPSQKLHVSGSARVTGAYYDSNNYAGEAGKILGSTATGTEWIKNSPTKDLTGEPSGSDAINNIVSLTQAEYDAGTPVSDTLYIIT